MMLPRMLRIQITMEATRSPSHVNDGLSDSLPATVSVTINPVDDAPVVTGQSVTVNQDEQIVIALIGSDVDGDAVIFSAVNPSHGTVAVSGANATYKPTAGYSGPDSFTFFAFSIVNNVPVFSPSATVLITVTPPQGFSTWLDGFGLVAGPGDDSDDDSISNAVEYVIGGNPANQPDTALLPTITMVNADPDDDQTSDDYLLFTYRRTDLANEDPNTSVKVEWATSLAGPWTEADGNNDEVIVVTDNPGVDVVEVYVPRSLSVGGKIFARLGVVVTQP